MAPRFGTLVRTLVLVIRPASRQPAATVVHPTSTYWQTAARPDVYRGQLSGDAAHRLIEGHHRDSYLHAVRSLPHTNPGKALCYPRRSSISFPVTISPPSTPAIRRSWRSLTPTLSCAKPIAPSTSEDGGVGRMACEAMIICYQRLVRSYRSGRHRSLRVIRHAGLTDCDRARPATVGERRGTLPTACTPQLTYW